MKREKTIASRIPEDLESDLRRIEEAEHLDRSSTVRRLLYRAIRDWKLEHAAKLYQDSRASLERTAEEAGVSVREMMDYLRQRKIPMQYELEDFEEDLKEIAKHTRQ
jgi:predicted HTH domain antitoxin